MIVQCFFFFFETVSFPLFSVVPVGDDDDDDDVDQKGTTDDTASSIVQTELLESPPSAHFPPRSSSRFALQGSTRPSCCLSRRGRAHIRSREEAASRRIGVGKKTKNKMQQHPAPPRLAGERRVALCVKHWSSDASLVTWAFVKNWFLRVREERRARKRERISTDERIFFRSLKTKKKLSTQKKIKNSKNRNAAPRTAPTRSPRSTGSTSSMSGVAVQSE